MDRRAFLSSLSAATAATIASAPTLAAKADALEDAMNDALTGKRRQKPPGLCYVDGGPEWEAWDRKTTEAMNRAQNADGSWTGHHCITGRTFVTAMAVMVLETTPEGVRQANSGGGRWS